MNAEKEERLGKRPRRQFEEAYIRRAVELTLRGTGSAGRLADEPGATDAMLYERRRRFARRSCACRSREIIRNKSLGILSENRDRP